MNFPPYWARGASGDFVAWRWSFRDMAEAQVHARQAAEQLADRFRTGNLPPGHEYYPDRPFREEVLRTITDEGGQISAVITRNSYGCQVLNTARVMFVDIDLPEPEPPPGILRRLFGKPELQPSGNAETDALARVENWTRNHPDWGWRVYRTRSGLRLLATQDLVDSASEATGAIFEALRADPLYRKLCSTQKCFRARLTPKPWRCGVYRGAPRWPWLDGKQEKAFQKWQAKYGAAQAQYATCAFVRQIGKGLMHPQVAPLLKLHDTTTRAESGLPLA